MAARRSNVSDAPSDSLSPNEEKFCCFKGEEVKSNCGDAETRS